MTTFTNTINNLHINLPFKIVTTNYDVSLQDYIIGVGNTSTNSITIKLPTPTKTGPQANVGKTIIIKDQFGVAQAFPIKIVSSNGIEIDGTDELFINTNHGEFAFYSDGTAWFSFISVSPEMVWQTNSAGQTLMENRGYFVSHEDENSIELFPLPDKCGYGRAIEVVNVQGPMAITKTAEQAIIFGNKTLSQGSTGELGSSDKGDAIRLICSQTNTTFVVQHAIGNWRLS